MVGFGDDLELDGKGSKIFITYFQRQCNFYFDDTTTISSHLRHFLVDKINQNCVK